MSKYTFEQYKSIFDGAIKKYEGLDFFTRLIQNLGQPAFPSEPGDVAIIGIRHEGKETHFRENTADDTIALIRVDEAGKHKGYEYIGTTESGFFKEVINPQGDFKMSPGFYYFKRGLHKGKYPCLVQACDVLGERAKKGAGFDEADDKTWQITDGTIHIHAGIMNTSNVGNWSAGCTVIAGGWEGAAWKQFFDFCAKTKRKTIPYVLVNETDIPQFLAAGSSSGSNGSNGAEAAQPSPVAITFDSPRAEAEAAPQTPLAGGGMRFDRDAFWSVYRQGLTRTGEKIQTEEVPHVNNILDRAERDTRIQSISQLAYMLTTARWETDRYRALFERGGDAYLSQYQGRGGNTHPGDYKRFRGTGYVHLTFRDNFRRAGEKIGAPLEDKPELAADPHWAYEIMVRGHLEGWFTTRKLGEFVGGGRKDFRNARKVINPGELSIADKAIATGGKSKRQLQCIEALSTQVKWANMIEQCLQASTVEAPATDAFSADDMQEAESGRELKPEPAATDAAASTGMMIPQSTQATGMQTSQASDISAAPLSEVQTMPDAVASDAQTSVPVKKGGFIQASVGSIKRMNAAIFGGIAIVIAGIRGFIEQNPMLSVVIILVSMAAVVWLVSWYIHIQRDLDKKRMEMAADPTKNNVR